MHHLNSTLPQVLLPVDKNSSVFAVPFLPEFILKPIAKSAKTSVLSQWFSQHFSSYKKLSLSKISGLKLLVPTSLAISALLWLPFSSLSQTHTNPTATSLAVATPVATNLEQIIAKKTLTIATTQGDSTFFGSDGFEHGFGHDVMNNYANSLGVNLKTIVVTSDEQALAVVNSGRADMALTSMPIAANDASMTVLSVSCQNDFLTQHGLSRFTSVAMPNAYARLVANTQAYLCDKKVLNTNRQLASFYTTQVFDNQYSQNQFIKTIATNLPNYRSTFQQSAKKHNLDWQLLVAMGYQESQLQPDAVSPTGVKGIMMLTNETAEQMGVDDRINPLQSIQGGAKYLNLLNQQFIDIPQSDRIWFTLAGYNMGPQAVRNIQEKLRLQGRNGNSWAEVYTYLAQHAADNGRYVQCMQYVTHIRGYLEALKLGNLADKADRKVA